MTQRHQLEMQLFHGLMLALIGLAAVVLGAFLLGSYFEKPYLSYTNAPFPALEAARPGEPVQLMIGRCNNSRHRHSYIVTHQLRNVASGAVLLMPETRVDIAPGCVNALSRLHVVPADTPPGVYVVTGSALVDGLIAHHVVPWESAPFAVLPVL